MFRTSFSNQNDNHKIIDQKGKFSVFEYDHDYSVSEDEAIKAYFAAKMNIRKRQVIINMNDNGVIVQAGMMQIMMGDLEAKTNVKGAGDLFKKYVGSKVTGETAIKPRYFGNGTLFLEPTYKFVILEDLANWNGNMVIEDGMFLACDDTVNMNVVARSNISSALLGQEGLFNNALSGVGIVALESRVPQEELLVVDLQDDVVKIDGDMAIAWSNTLTYTVERTTKTLVGSAATKEGLVNVFRGSGRILIAPVEEKRKTYYDYMNEKKKS